MTTAPSHATTAAGPHTPTIGSLLSAELTRVRSRRFVRGAVIGLFAIIAFVACITFFQSASASDAQIAQARSICGNASSADAFDESGNPVPGVSAEPCSIRDAAQGGYFDKRPNIRSDIPEEILGVGIGVAVLGFLLGCTVGGADWSQKTMAALLFWEPRRARVFFVKLAALLISMVAILVAATIVWLAIKSVLIGTHGIWADGEKSIVGPSLDYFGRSIVLVATMSALAYGLASLTRNTGAALGVGFVYFAIVELALQALLPRFSVWFLTTNIGALATPGGLQKERDGAAHAVSSLSGGIHLVAYAAIICIVGLELFRRRDVT